MGSFTEDFGAGVGNWEDADQGWGSSGTLSAVAGVGRLSNDTNFKVGVAIQTATPLGGDDQVAKFQIKNRDNEGLGFALRAPATPGNHYQFRNSSGAGTWRLEEVAGDGAFDHAVTGNTGAISIEDEFWYLVRISGSGTAMTVEIWKSATDLGDDPADWGAPDDTVTSTDSTTLTGNEHVGYRAYTGGSGDHDLGYTEFDNYHGSGPAGAVQAAMAFAGEAALSAEGSAPRAGSAVLTGEAGAAIAARTEVLAAAALAGQGDLRAVATVGPSAAAGLIAAADLRPAAGTVRAAAAVVAGEAALVLVPAAGALALVALAGEAAFSAEAAAAGVSARLAGEAEVVALGTVPRAAALRILASSDLRATAGTGASAAAALIGEAFLAGQAVTIAPAAPGKAAIVYVAPADDWLVTVPPDDWLFTA